MIRSSVFDEGALSGAAIAVKKKQFLLVDFAGQAIAAPCL
jgi:hypothetical protein